jgi:hypothetical protein
MSASGMMEGPSSADSEEKREPASSTYTATVDGLKALDPNRPVREADMNGSGLLPCKLNPEPYFAGRKRLM